MPPKRKRKTITHEEYNTQLTIWATEQAQELHDVTNAKNRNKVNDKYRKKRKRLEEQLPEHTTILEQHRQRDTDNHARRRKEALATNKGHAKLSSIREKNTAAHTNHRATLASTTEGRAKLNEKNTTAHAAHRHEEKQEHLSASMLLQLQEEADPPEISKQLLQEIEARFRRVKADFVHTHVCLVCDGIFRRSAMYLRKMGDIPTRVLNNIQVCHHQRTHPHQFNQTLFRPI